MKVSEITNWHASDKQYVDLNVYVDAGDWDYEFRITLDKSTGEISVSVLAGAQPDGVYEECGDVPAAVLEAAAPMIAKARQQLQALREAA